VPFAAPFFSESIDQCLRDPARLLFWRETSLSTLRDWATARPGLPPCGLIFHLSRCGSTLICQMLASLRSTLVLSEPGPLDQVLRLVGGRRASTAVAPIPGSQRAASDWLRWTVSALGQRRFAGQDYLVVKLDAWAIFDWRLITETFPGTPSIFVYRDPAQVLLSHLGHRGYHMVPGTLPLDYLGLPAGLVDTLSPEEYGAAVLGRMCAAAVDAVGQGTMEPVPYSSLPAAVTDVVAPRFGITVPDHDRGGLDHAARRDAKNPFLPFDPERQGAKVTPSLRRAIDRFAAGPYEALRGLSRVPA
jgi:hypothetical protein